MVTGAARAPLQAVPPAVVLGPDGLALSLAVRAGLQVSLPCQRLNRTGCAGGDGTLPLDADRVRTAGLSFVRGPCSNRPSVRRRIPVMASK